MKTHRPSNMAWPYVAANHPLYHGVGFGGLCPHPGGYGCHDFSPYMNHAALTGMNPNTDWTWDSALSRNSLKMSQGAVVRVPYKAILYPGLVFSFAVWVNSNVTDYTSSGYVIGQYTTGGDARQWALRVNSTGDVFGVVVSADGTSLTTASSDTTQAVQTGWHHIACNVTRSSDANSASYWDFYYDGVFKQQLTVTKGFVNRSASLDIGGITGNSNSWLGGIADPMYFPNSHINTFFIRKLAEPGNSMLSGLIVEQPRKLRALASTSNRRRRFLIAVS